MIKVIYVSDSMRPEADNAEQEIRRFFRSLDFEGDQNEVSSKNQLLMKLVETASINRRKSRDVARLVMVEAMARIDNRRQQMIPLSWSPEDAAKRIGRHSRLCSAGSVALQLADRYPEVLQLAQSKPAEQVGVEAISALLELKQWELLGEALKGDDTVRCDRNGRSAGQFSSGAINGLLMPVIKNADVNIDVRRAAVKAASKVNNGAAELVKLVDEKSLDPELEQTVAAALHSSPSREARTAGSATVPAASVEGQHADPADQRADKARGQHAKWSHGVFLNRYVSQVPRR